MLRMPDTERGRYFLSRDTVYMVKKMGKKLFRFQGYALIDTFRKKVTLFPGDSIREKEYRLIQLSVDLKQHWSKESGFIPKYP